MSTHKAIDKICCVSLAVAIALTVLFINADSLGLQAASAAPGYETRLFDTSRVHSIDVIMDDWDEFTANCQSEEYSPCAVVIDGEAYKNVTIRAKGNTSLTQVAAYGNDRYSFKIEFDHYDDSGSYYGLDKLCLNNLIQDNTYMKDYLCYRLMNEMGVASPLCSYVFITVNGEDWGLYLAVEGVEEAFLRRNYGTDYGNLYKPDSLGMGGGRGNGMDFDISDFMDAAGGFLPGGNGGGGSSPGAAAPGLQLSGGGPGDIRSPGGEGFGGGMISGGSDDVLLKYIDDDFDSYSNIFDNAKTDVTSSDKTRLIESLKRLSSGEDLESTVDVEAVIRYFVVHNFVLNFDSYTGSMIHNYYLYEKDGQLQMIPWDYNLAFGGFSSGDGAESLVNYPIDSPVSGGSTEDRPMLSWIFESAEYTALYHQCFSELISGIFDSGYFESMLDSVTEMISPYVERDPTKFCTYEEFQTGVLTLREFCLLRAESAAGQLNGSIGSTAETQDAGALVSAGTLQISDIGSMNGAMGGDIPSMPDNAGGIPSMPDNAGGNMPSMPDNVDGSGGSFRPGTPEQSSGAAQTLVYGGASLTVLLAGLAFAFFYRRRK